MMTVTEAAAVIDTLVTVSLDGLQVPCRVLNARLVWGRWQFEVQPVSGRGSKWVELGRIVAPATRAAVGGSAVTPGEVSRG